MDLDSWCRPSGISIGWPNLKHMLLLSLATFKLIHRSSDWLPIWNISSYLFVLAFSYWFAFVTYRWLKRNYLVFTIASYKKAVLITELEEKVLILKQSMKKAIRDIADTEPRLVHETGNLLREYIRGHHGPEEYMTPRVWFVMEQTNLTAIELKKRLSNGQLTFFDIREDLSNLAALCVYISEVDRPAYLELRARFCKLIGILGGLANRLESRTHVQCTNWSAVLKEFEDSDSSLDESPPTDERLARELLDNIEEAHLIGVGGFGCCHKILFRKHLPLTVKIVLRTRGNRPHHAPSDKAFASITRNRYLSRFVACIPTDDYYILIQEYIRGVDVQKLLNDHTGLPVNLCRVIMAQLGCVVHYLQVKGFIHRDIKPSNMMIMQDCRIKLIDYDTVKICTGKYEKGPSKSFIRKTFFEFNDGESSGTTMYLAPEVVQHLPYGRACDWWSMGVTLHCLSAGRLPFRNTSKGKLRKLITNANLASLPKLQDEDQHALSRSLMNRDIYKRITGARFHEYRDHPFFKTIDWATIEKGRGPLESYEPLTRMFEEKSRGRTSPKREILTIRPRRLKRVVNIEMARKQTVASVPLYTFISETAREILERTNSNDDSISESDLSDPVDEYYEEVQKPQLKMDTYRFEKFLREPS